MTEPLRAIKVRDVICYQTIAGDYCANYGRYFAWGNNRDRAIIKLGLILAEDDIPFDFSELEKS
jgi:hypothetical protein